MSEENKTVKEKPVKVKPAKKRRIRGEANTERANAIRDFFKSLIVPVAFCALIGLAIFLIVHFVNPETEPVKIIPYGYEGGEEPVVMENDDLIFEMDPLTTRFTITKKSTGKVWSSYIENAESDGRALSEASGGITSENVRQVAETGVDIISLGALTHSVKAMDISMKMVK